MSRNVQLSRDSAQQVLDHFRTEVWLEQAKALLPQDAVVKAICTEVSVKFSIELDHAVRACTWLLGKMTLDTHKGLGDALDLDSITVTVNGQAREWTAEGGSWDVICSLLQLILVSSVYAYCRDEMDTLFDRHFGPTMLAFITSYPNVPGDSVLANITGALPASLPDEHVMLPSATSAFGKHHATMANDGYVITACPEALSAVFGDRNSHISQELINAVDGPIPSARNPNDYYKENGVQTFFTYYYEDDDDDDDPHLVSDACRLGVSFKLTVQDAALINSEYEKATGESHHVLVHHATEITTKPHAQRQCWHREFPQDGRSSDLAAAIQQCGPPGGSVQECMLNTYANGM